MRLILHILSPVLPPEAQSSHVFSEDGGSIGLAVAADRVVDGVSRFRRFLTGGTTRASAPFAFVDEWLVTVSAWLQWLAPVGRATADRAVNWSTAAVLLGLLWFVWRRALFGVWTAWSANRTAEVFRRVDKPRQPLDVKPSDRLTASMVPVVANGLFLIATVPPIAVSLLWTYAPGRVNEAGLYWVLGLVPVAMFLVMLAIGVAGAAADEAAEVSRALSNPSARRLQWPNVSAGVRWVYKLAFSVALVLAIIGSTLAVAKPLVKIAMPIMGVGMYLLAMRATLDRCWQLMEDREVRSPLRTGLMLLPLAGGIVFVLALRDRAEVGALVSVGALLSLLGGLMLLWVLRRVLRRPSVS